VNNKHAGQQSLSAGAELQLDRDSGEIFACNETARLLLPAAGLIGGDWREMLGLDASSYTPLATVIKSGLRAALPPLLLRPPGGSETVVGGYLYPHANDKRRGMTLLLFRLVQDEELEFIQTMAPGDVVVVLGVEPAHPAAVPDGAATARIMMDVYASLQQIVPVAEDVALPRGATIALLLRQLPVEQALDIGRAVLSHLGPLLATQLRARIGLARRETGSPLATTVAANSALTSLQFSDPGEFIAVASESDQAVLAVGTTSSDGLFSAAVDSVEQYAYLAGLLRLKVDAKRSMDYLEAVVAHTLAQPGVAAVSVYRRDHKSGFRFVTAAVDSDEQVQPVAEKDLPRAVRRCKFNSEEMMQCDLLSATEADCAILPLKTADNLLGCLLLYSPGPGSREAGPFAPGVAAMHYLATSLLRYADWRDSDAQAPVLQRPTLPPEEELEGYVADNMEGAIDQAVFLARVDVPVAVIGPRGTGKLYVARIIHQEWGGAPEDLVAIDCRAFRSRKEALKRIARELEHCEGKTLVFKSPHLMHSDAQLKLARQISSRVLADSQPPRYLPRARFVALLPDTMEHLLRFGGLNEKLASVFAGYPVRVPPIRDRKRAVLRWAHKILAQEAGRRDRRISGFTPDAEQAMLQHDWPGNISEMRQCICAALDKSDKEWVTPVDIGLFKGLSVEPTAAPPGEHPFLQSVMEPRREEVVYSASPLEDLRVALGESLHSMLENNAVKPLGAWLEDELVLAVCDRFQGNKRAAAELLHTKPRNIGRWLPAIEARNQERNASLLWQAPRQLVRQWVLEAAVSEQAPQQLLQGMLLSHIQRQCHGVSTADRARIMGMSTPTYLKRLRELSGEQTDEEQQ
jgi:DNA-binding NtrC family response regulator